MQRQRLLSLSLHGSFAWDLLHHKQVHGVGQASGLTFSSVSPAASPQPLDSQDFSAQSVRKGPGILGPGMGTEVPPEMLRSQESKRRQSCPGSPGLGDRKEGGADFQVECSPTEALTRPSESSISEFMSL